MNIYKECTIIHVVQKYSHCGCWTHTNIHSAININSVLKEIMLKDIHTNNSTINPYILKWEHVNINTCHTNPQSLKLASHSRFLCYKYPNAAEQCSLTIHSTRAFKTASLQSQRQSSSGPFDNWVSVQKYHAHNTAQHQQSWPVVILNAGTWVVSHTKSVTVQGDYVDNANHALWTSGSKYSPKVAWGGTGDFRCRSLGHHTQDWEESQITIQQYSGNMVMSSDSNPGRASNITGSFNNATTWVESVRIFYSITHTVEILAQTSQIHV